MNTGKKLSEISQQSVKNNNIIKLQIAMAIALIFTSAFSIESKTDIYKTLESSQSLSPEKNKTEDENRESTSFYEATFKEGIRRTLTTVNSLTDIPVGGKKIDYYRLE
jgi:hypothetical protein